MARKLNYPKGTWMNLTSAGMLRELMEARSFDQARLARYAGCSQSFISQLLRGKKSSCSQELAVAISEALSVPASVLFVPSDSTDGRSFRKRQTRKAVA
jgi:transcriptional regulator with XRE-family HTH domain